MQSFPGLFLRFELVAKHHCLCMVRCCRLVQPFFSLSFFFFLHDSGVRGRRMTIESRESGWHNKFTHCEAKRFWSFEKNWKTTRLPSLACRF